MSSHGPRRTEARMPDSAAIQIARDALARVLNSWDACDALARDALCELALAADALNGHLSEHVDLNATRAMIMHNIDIDRGVDRGSTARQASSP